MGADGDAGVGTVLAGYRLRTVLGRDHLGVVYLAEDVRLGRRAALRLLDPELTADERFRERVLRESELAGSLAHPGIVPVLEAGEAEGRLYVATADVEGTDLATVLAREGRLEPVRALAVVTQLADALDAARWGRGLVHGALSPAAVLVVPDGEGGSAHHVLLRGFGLRREPLPGDRSGALAYLAPEQIDDRPVSPRTDVYALGCLFFECLTARAPYAGAPPEAHLYKAPPSASRLGSGLPPAVDGVIGKALAKWPEERYSTCTELAAAAREAFAPAGEPSEPLPQAPVQRAPRPKSAPSSEGLSSAEPVPEEIAAPVSWSQRLTTGGWKAIAVGLACLLAGLTAAVVWLAARDTGDGASATSAAPAVAQRVELDPDGSAAGAAVPDEPSVEVEPGAEPGPFGAGAGSDTPEPVLSRVPGSLVQLGAATGIILSRLAVPSPRLLASDGRFVWLLGGEDGTERLVRIDAAANGGTAIFDAARLGEGEAALAAVRGGVWLNGEQGTAYRLARGASAAELVTFADPGGGDLNFVGGQVAAADSLWVSAFPPGPCCTFPPDLYRVDPVTGNVIARIDGAQEVVAAGPGFVWALGEHVLGNRPELVRVDTETHTTVPIGVLDFSWVDLAVADGSVWASSPEDATIVRLDPLTGEVRERIGVGGVPVALAAGGGAVWAAILTGAVARYDIGTGEIQTFDIGGIPTSLVFAAGSVWVAVDEPEPR
jgi:serine/threonine-protein kinase